MQLLLPLIMATLVALWCGITYGVFKLKMVRAAAHACNMFACLCCVRDGLAGTLNKASGDLNFGMRSAAYCSGCVPLGIAGAMHPASYPPAFYLSSKHICASVLTVLFFCCLCCCVCCQMQRRMTRSTRAANSIKLAHQSPWRQVLIGLLEGPAGAHEGTVDYTYNSQNVSPLHPGF